MKQKFFLNSQKKNKKKKIKGGVVIWKTVGEVFMSKTTWKSMKIQLKVQTVHSPSHLPEGRTGVGRFRPLGLMFDILCLHQPPMYNSKGLLQTESSKAVLTEKLENFKQPHYKYG